MQECDTKELIECYNKIIEYIKSLEGKKEEADKVKEDAWTNRKTNKT